MVEHVTRSHAFKDEELFYRLCAGGLDVEQGGTQQMNPLHHGEVKSSPAARSRGASVARKK